MPDQSTTRCVGDWLAGTRPDTRRLQHVYIRTVNSYLSWLREEGHIDQRLRVKLLKCPLHVPTLLSPADVRALVAFRPSAHAERRAWVLGLLLLDTGIRIAEALG
jgi:site-specific recombinase XerD